MDMTWDGIIVMEKQRPLTLCRAIIYMPGIILRVAPIYTQFTSHGNTLGSVLLLSHFKDERTEAEQLSQDHGVIWDRVVLNLGHLIAETVLFDHFPLRLG